MPSRRPLMTGWREVHRLLEAGYEKWRRGAEAGACGEWLKAWSLLLKTMDETGLRRLSEIDHALAGRPPVSAWVPELHMMLWNAGLKEPRFLEEGLRFTAEFVRRFGADDLGLTQDVRCALASFHAMLGRLDTADALFRGWLTADPRWGWGWIRWAECYSFRPWENEELAARGVEILREGAAVPGVHDLKFLLADLESLLADLQRDRESRAVRRQLLALAEVEPEAQEAEPLCELPSWLEADRLILDGYDRREAGDGPGAVRLWLAAWASFLPAMDEGRVDDLDDFDDQVSGYGYVPHWSSDLANVVWDAAYEDRGSIASGLQFTTAFLSRFETHEGYVTEDVRRVHGLLHARAGRLADADALFRRWLSEDSRWGWGWIYWAACYTYGAPEEMSDDGRSVEILKQGAAVPGLRDARDVLQELADQLSFVGREADAVAVRRRRDALPEDEPNDDEPNDASSEPKVGAATLRVSLPGGKPSHPDKVGRNERCPCGSGKKHKRCCGR